MTDRVGQQLGNYRLISLLGDGGFAEVYLGEHVYLRTKAAIKVLHTQLAQDGMEGFLNEARTIANLVHPHIVRVLEFGLEGTTPYLVINYAPGGTLRKQHPKGTILPFTTIISYVKQVADALQYAHDQRVIHRDVKPENMLVGEHDELLLSDFGIAIVDQSSRYSSTQNMGGTMAYIAPEQIKGHPRTASDQYSLGIVVYEWLSGDRPFHGSMMEIVGQHLAASPPALCEKMPTLSPDVEHVVLTALAKDPKQRFGSVQEFAAALEQASRVALSVAVTHALERPVPSQPLAASGIGWSTELQASQQTPPPGISNVFLFNQKLSSPGEFFGRARERISLLDRTSKQASTSIVGPRRIGKTWLINYLQLVAHEKLGSRFRLSYLDATTPQYATVAGFAASVLELLTLKKYSFADKQEALLVLDQEVQELARGQVLVLCIDEFEGLGNRQEFDLHFFTALRALAHRDLCLVVASKQPLIDIVGDNGKTSGFFNIFKQCTLEPFSKKEAEGFVQSKGDQAHLTEQERQDLLRYGQVDGAWWPIRLQLVGEMLLEDKILAMRENDPDYYRPADPDYWQAFEHRLEQTYRGVVR